jgi:hypothetical protein
MTAIITAPINLELTAERVGEAVQAVLDELGQPQTELHRAALAAFEQGNSALVKRLAVINLSDSYCRALKYLVSAPKLTPNTDTILSEAARSAADFVREQAVARLSDKFSKALG